MQFDFTVWIDIFEYQIYADIQIFQKACLFADNIFEEIVAEISVLKKPTIVLNLIFEICSVFDFAIASLNKKMESQTKIPKYLLFIAIGYVVCNLENC